MYCGTGMRRGGDFDHSTLHVPEDLVGRYSDVVFQISTKCPNIKSMDLFDQNMPDKFFLMSIANLFPKLETIQFKTGSIANETEEMSYYLDSIKNLKKLNWDKFNIYTMGYLKENDQNMIDVLQKLNYLNIHLHYFVQLNVSLDSLVELHLNDFRDNYYENDSDVGLTDQLTLPNLKKFYFKFYRCVNFSLIKKLKFEQLEIAEIDYDPFLCTPPHYLDMSFSDQFKSIKVLHCIGIQFGERSLIPIKGLTELSLSLSGTEESFIHYGKFSSVIGMINDMINHKSLEKIIFKTFYEYESRFSEYLFDKWIILGQTKPTAKIEIEQKYSCLNKDKRQTLNRYEQEFKTNNWEVLIIEYKESDIKLSLRKN